MNFSDVTRAALLGSAIVILAGATSLALAADPAARPADGRTDPADVRTVAIEAGARGFVPDTVRLVAGEPADLVFTRTSPSGCMAQVHIPDLGVDRTELTLNEPVTIRVQPAAEGVYEFRCGMDMRRGTIIVAPAAKR